MEKGHEFDTDITPRRNRRCAAPLAPWDMPAGHVHRRGTLHALVELPKSLRWARQSSAISRDLDHVSWHPDHGRSHCSGGPARATPRASRLLGACIGHAASRRACPKRLATSCRAAQRGLARADFPIGSASWVRTGGVTVLDPGVGLGPSRAPRLSP